MDIQDLVPKEKGDVATAEQLENLSYQVTKPIIPQLLDWLADMNWPVAGPVSEYLVSILDDITDEVLDVFATDDHIWKYWVIGLYQHPKVNSIDPRIVIALERFADDATDEEKEEEIDLVSREVLKGLE